MKKIVVCMLILFAVTGCTQAAGTDAQETEAAEAAQTVANADIINISISELAPGEVVCVGSFELDGGKISYDVSADAGNKLFVGFYTHGGLLSGTGVTWDKWTAGYILPFTGDERSVKVSEGVGSHEGLYYVYVGCEREGETLSNIAGTIIYGD